MCIKNYVTENSDSQFNPQIKDKQQINILKNILYILDKEVCRSFNNCNIFIEKIFLHLNITVK